MAKGEKRSGKKRLAKQIESLLKRAKEHRIKAGTQKGEKDTTPAYWTGEAERFEKHAKEKEEMLKKLEGKESEEKEEKEAEASE